MKHLNSAKNINYDTVKRLFSLQIAIIYHGFTVVTLTAPWYCGRNVGYSYELIILSINIFTAGSGSVGALGEILTPPPNYY